MASKELSEISTEELFEKWIAADSETDMHLNKIFGGFPYKLKLALGENCMCETVNCIGCLSNSSNLQFTQILNKLGLNNSFTNTSSLIRLNEKSYNVEGSS